MAACGKANLLLTSKFKQYRELCYDYEVCILEFRYTLRSAQYSISCTKFVNLSLAGHLSIHYHCCLNEPIVPCRALHSPILHIFSSHTALNRSLRFDVSIFSLSSHSKIRTIYDK